MLLVTAILIFNWFTWKAIKTENFTIFYKPGYGWEAMQALQNLEYYRDKVIDITGNDLGNTAIVIEDVGIMPNGFANPVFRDIHLFTYPPYGDLMGMTENWYREVGIHEYTHMTHMRKTGGLAGVMTAIFGTIFQPNMISPGWIAEGITVYTESQLSPYEGRLNDGFFDAYMACRTSSNQLPSITEATFSPMAFPFYSGSYLYGGEFFNYLAGRYGEEEFSRFFKTYGLCCWSPCLNIISPIFGVDIAAYICYGRGFQTLFSEWHGYLKEKYQDWQVDGEQLSERGWFCTNLVSGDNRIYYFREYPVKTDALSTFHFYKIVEYDVAAGREKIIIELNSPVIAPMKMLYSELYYATMELKKYYANLSQHGYGVVANIYCRNLDNNSTEMLFADAVRAFAPMSDKQIIYSKDRSHQFGSEIWQYRNGSREKIWETEYLIGDVEINDRWVVVSARRDYENWDLFTWNTTTKELKPILTTPWMEINPHLNGDTLIFTANYNGCYSIYAIDLKTNRQYQLTKGGFANSGLIVGNKLYFLGINPKGLDLYCKEVEFDDCDLADWPASAKPDFTGERLKVSQGGYFDLFKTFLDPDVRIPFIFPADTTLEAWHFGALLLNTDAANENVAITYVAYDGLNQEPVIMTNFQSLFFLPVMTTLNYEYNSSIALDFYVPVVYRINTGLTDFSLGLEMSAQEAGYARKELMPYLTCGFNYPRNEVMFMLGVPVERQRLKSSVDRTAQIMRFLIRNYIAGGEFQIAGGGINDPDSPDSINIMIRGGKVVTRTGGALTLEYCHPLLKIRKGFWNPNIYFEDLCGSIFSDYCVSREGEFSYSFGAELKLEIGALLGFVKFAPAIGFAFNKDQEISYYVTVGSAPFMK